MRHAAQQFGLRPAALANRFPSERPGDDLPRTLHGIGDALSAISESLQDVYMRHVTMARLPGQTGTARLPGQTGTVGGAEEGVP